MGPGRGTGLHPPQTEAPSFITAPTGGAPTQRHPHQPGGEGEADPLFPHRRWVEAWAGREGVGLPGAPAPQWGLAGGFCCQAPSQCLCARPSHQHHSRAVCQLRGLQPLAALPADGLPQGRSSPTAWPRELPRAAGVHTGEGPARTDAAPTSQVLGRRVGGEGEGSCCLSHLPSACPLVSRSWVVAEARSPQMDEPAGAQGAQHPRPRTPATLSLSPRCRPPQAAPPSLCL